MPEKRQFLYHQVYSSLKQDIITGRYEYGALLPSEKEISVQFGVERTTVRKALDLLVREDVAEKQAGVGTRVIYQGGIQIQPVSSNSKMIGFFMMDDAENSRKITQPYYADLFYYLEIECKARNCRLIYATIDNSTNITEVLQSQNFLSAVFVTHTEKKLVEKAKELGVDTILVNEYLDGCVAISYDNEDGAYRVMEYLHRMGHKKIAVISGPQQFYSSREKLAGCMRAMGEFDLRIPEEGVLEGDWEFQSGYSLALGLFEKTAGQDRPTALFAFNDMMCIGAMRALRELSIDIPGDVSVVGFDNMGQLQYTEPDLTTVDSHVALMAKIIVENAVSKPFSTFPCGIKILIPTELVKRKTVRKI